ncbi:MAG: SemiSWEET family transporter [Chloroflexota bacterium]
MWWLIGIVAASLTTLGFVPQVVKMWRSKSVLDLSLLTFCQMLVGSSLWLLYGLHLKDPVIVGANVVTGGVLVLALALYHRFSRRKPE